MDVFQNERTIVKPALSRHSLASKGNKNASECELIGGRWKGWGQNESFPSFPLPLLAHPIPNSPHFFLTKGTLLLPGKWKGNIYYIGYLQCSLSCENKVSMLYTTLLGCLVQPKCTYSPTSIEWPSMKRPPTIKVPIHLSVNCCI